MNYATIENCILEEKSIVSGETAKVYGYELSATKISGKVFGKVYEFAEVEEGASVMETGHVGVGAVVKSGIKVDGYVAKGAVANKDVPAGQILMKTGELLNYDEKEHFRKYIHHTHEV